VNGKNHFQPSLLPCDHWVGSRLGLTACLNAVARRTTL